MQVDGSFEVRRRGRRSLRARGRAWRGDGRRPARIDPAGDRGALRRPRWTSALSPSSIAPVLAPWSRLAVGQPPTRRSSPCVLRRERCSSCSRSPGPSDSSASRSRIRSDRPGRNACRRGRGPQATLGVILDAGGRFASRTSWISRPSHRRLPFYAGRVDPPQRVLRQSNKPRGVGKADPPQRDRVRVGEVLEVLITARAPVGPAASRFRGDTSHVNAW